MKAILVAIALVMFGSLAAMADRLSTNTGGASIQVPTGVEVKDQKSDVVLNPDGSIKKETDQDKKNREMLDATERATHDG